MAATSGTDLFEIPELRSNRPADITRWSQLVIQNLNRAGSTGVTDADTWKGLTIVSTTITTSLGSGINGSSSYTLVTEMVGVSRGDSVFLGPPPTLEAGLIGFARVSSTNELTLIVYNTATSSVGTTTQTWRVRVVK